MMKDRQWFMKIEKDLTIEFKKKVDDKFLQLPEFFFSQNQSQSPHLFCISFIESFAASLKMCLDKNFPSRKQFKTVCT